MAACPGGWGARAEDSVREDRAGSITSAPAASPSPRVTPLALRVLSAFVGVPILVGVTLAGGPVFLLAATVGSGLGMLEFAGMVRKAGHRPLAPLGVALAAGLVLAAASGQAVAAPAVVAVAAVAGLLWLLGRVDEPGALADWSLSLAPALYVGGLFSFFVPLRSTADGNGLLWLLVALVSTWFCDVAAYFVGGAWGRRKLAPKISPGKSVEGAVAGVIAAAGTALLVGPLLGGLLWALATLGLPTPPLPDTPSAARLLGLGAVVGVLAVLGDLLESFVKRQCGAKDSGALIPGHGGVLDRMDSVMLAVAGAYLYVVATA